MSLCAFSQDLATNTAVPDCGPESVLPIAGVRVRGVANRASQVAPRVPGLALMIEATASACAWVGFRIEPVRLSVAAADPPASSDPMTADALEERVSPTMVAVAIAST